MPTQSAQPHQPSHGFAAYALGLVVLLVCEPASCYLEDASLAAGSDSGSKVQSAQFDVFAGGDSAGDVGSPSHIHTTVLSSS
jgi:hypothetical protein